MREGSAKGAPIGDALIQNAKEEMAHAKEYSFQIINDDLETAYVDLKNVILARTDR